MKGLRIVANRIAGLLVMVPTFAFAQVLDDLPQLPQELPQLPASVERLDNRVHNMAERSWLPLRAAPVATVEQLTAPLTVVIPDVLELRNTLGQVVLRVVTVEDGWRAWAREWLVIAPADESFYWEALPVTVVARQQLTALELTVVRFRVAAPLDSREALQKVLPEVMHDSLARQHVYFAQQASADQTNSTPVEAKLACAAPVKLGVIDTQINSSLPQFSKAKIHQQTFLGSGLEQPLAHGTAVAGLWLAQAEELQPLLPNAELFAAEVFYQHNELSQGAPVSAIIEALNWLVEEGIEVINMSLTGPDNPILKLAVQRVSGHGTTIVAAAGNAGPAAPVLYPAGYEEVIAVTAVDGSKQVYRWANRGSHIDYAALGVDVKTLRPNGETSLESGTSMAAPVVSALLSCALSAGRQHKSVTDLLAPYVEDLGEAGPDPIFGRGLIRPHPPAG